MSNFDKLFTTNKKKEEEGVWINAGEGMEFLIARFNNPKAEKLNDELLKPYRRQLRMGRRIPEDVQRKITIAVLANAVLLNWRGMKDDDGKDVPHSVAEAERRMTEKKDFADFVAGCSTDVQLFQDEEEEARRGN